MRSLARWCFTYRRFAVLGWVVALIGFTAIHSAAGSAYSDNFELSAHPELRRGQPARANRPASLGRDRPAHDRGRSRQGHRPGSPRARPRPCSRRSSSCRTSAVISPVRRRAARSRSRPTGQVAFANVTFDDAANNKITRPPPSTSSTTITCGLRATASGRGRGTFAEAATSDTPRPASCSASSPPRSCCSSCSARCRRCCCRCSPPGSRSAPAPPSSACSRHVLDDGDVLAANWRC